MRYYNKNQGKINNFIYLSFVVRKIRLGETHLQYKESHQPTM